MGVSKGNVNGTAPRGRSFLFGCKEVAKLLALKTPIADHQAGSDGRGRNSPLLGAFCPKWEVWSDRSSLMTKHFPKPPFNAQPQPIPGRSDKMDPQPDYGEATYRGSNRLKDKKTVITGADSGIGRAVALAFAREGADVLVAYLDEHDDANETKRLVEEAGRKCVLLSGDVSTSDHCRQIVKRAVDEFGRIDVLVNNAAHQMSFNAIEEISDEEWEKTLSTNISAILKNVSRNAVAIAISRPIGRLFCDTARRMHATTTSEASNERWLPRPARLVRGVGISAPASTQN